MSKFFKIMYEGKKVGSLAINDKDHGVLILPARGLSLKIEPDNCGQAENRPHTMFIKGQN